MSDEITPPVVPSSETPSVAPSAETPTPPETPAEPTLYELPDGRKVDADTLTKEWKDNFLPEFTRKSQTLSEMERAGVQFNQPKDEQVPEWKDPNYVPQTYADLIEIAKQQTLAELQAQGQAQEQAKQQVEQMVETQLDGIKKIEPNLDENLLFAHAVKYKFNDLTVAFNNMKDLNVAVKLAEKQVVDNMKNRDNPIAGKPGGAGGSAQEGIDYNSVANDRSSPSEWLARYKGK
jgi:hypothetical protein